MQVTSLKKKQVKLELGPLEPADTKGSIFASGKALKTVNKAVHVSGQRDLNLIGVNKVLRGERDMLPIVTVGGKQLETA